MKILLDTCVWGEVLHTLHNAGYDVIWSGNWEKDPGDDEILQFAYNEKRVLITLDKDFGELVHLRNISHWGIVRIVPFPAKKQSRICLYVLKKYKVELKEKAIITVESDRIRIRK
jgi:predicted nuclease of predicted toxin-antitoxin system